MTARLLPLLLLALAAAKPDTEIYHSVSGKSDCTDCLRKGPTYYMRDGWCLGYLPPSYLCGSAAPVAVEVTVSDRVAFPMIEVDPTMRNASIARHPNASGVCRGVAHVTTRLRCQTYRLAKAKGVRPLPATNDEA
ncbi:uncharacterized protein LOC121729319 isoform X2 [Aricia agestis]|uniref:uncharacterized protein LOC121729319 isoform X2 n=1 Tax=Aricia agestis TaxID=91739 RepID=UPI001C202BFC|nr:uncharacterized protein LOC121729319 isoform X2 [Aricia agestis]